MALSINEIKSGVTILVDGLGLNLYLSENQGQEITQDWTDLTKLANGNPLARNALAGAILNELLTILNDYEQGGIAPYLAEWRSYDSLKGLPAVLYVGQHAIEGVVEGINEQGLLLLKKSDGSLQAYASGEVSFSKTTL